MEIHALDKVLILTSFVRPEVLTGKCGIMRAVVSKHETVTPSFLHTLSIKVSASLPYVVGGKPIDEAAPDQHD